MNRAQFHERSKKVRSGISECRSQSCRTFDRATELIGGLCNSGAWCGSRADETALLTLLEAPSICEPTSKRRLRPRCARRIWRPRRDSNPRPKVSSHFGFRRRQRRSWSGLSLHHRSKPVGAARPVSTPSPLRGLARDWHAANCEAFPDFEQIDHGVSDRNPQINRKPLLYPAELRGLYAFPLNPDASFCNAPLRAVAAFLQSGIPTNSRNAASAE